MNILFLSDSHQHPQSILDAVAATQPSCLVHLGDGFEDVDVVRTTFPALPIHQVPGNCDTLVQAPPERLVEIGGVRFFLCHGHTRGVKQSLLQAQLAAQSQGAQVLAFGHTHQPLYQSVGDLTLLNPGSVGLNGCYALLTIHDGAVTDCQLLHLHSEKK